ncbi:uncharacterized protein LOC143629673 [Bidens hawaiensis]|uniref:uncharacterized protein LOC143629673 n=1 Tax=Bidens hawaiensis TaxID=980011 RepID=UPI00404A5DD6
MGLRNKLFNSRLNLQSHFGVDSGATRFSIEHQAVNEATFCCPQGVPIFPSDGGISKARKTFLPVDEITKSLADMGYDVVTSDDAGRFVCNYVYYHSLRFAVQNGIKSLFVHVPDFETIDKNTQMQFVASLLEVLASLY